VNNPMDGTPKVPAPPRLTVRLNKEDSQKLEELVSLRAMSTKNGVIRALIIEAHAVEMSVQGRRLEIERQKRRIGVTSDDGPKRPAM